MNKKPSNYSKPNKKEKKFSTSNLILIILAVGTLAFILKMIQLFETCGSTPDTLITYYFISVVGEAGAMGWIKTSKVRKLERDWEVQDKEDEKKDILAMEEARGESD